MIDSYRLEYYSSINGDWHIASENHGSEEDAEDEIAELEESDPDEWEGTRWRVVGVRGNNPVTTRRIT